MTDTPDGAPWYAAIGQTEVRLNPSLYRTLDDGQQYVTDVITHELGHTFGLADYDRGCLDGLIETLMVAPSADCRVHRPSVREIADYREIYTPAGPSSFEGARSTQDRTRITFEWVADSVHVEQEFRIDRWEEPMGAPAGWVRVTDTTATANAETFTITDQDSEPREYRVVAVTEALRGTSGDAPSNTAIVPGLDTKLSALTVTGATFTFDPGTTTHRVSVSSSSSRTTVTATASDSAATVVIVIGTNNGASPKVVDLGYGRTTIEITVTNGGVARAYTLVITRPRSAPPPTYSWSASCPDGTSDSGTGYATQALADAAKAAFLADCPTYSWSATCPDGTSDSGTGYATPEAAAAAKAAFLADCPTYSWSASCPDGTSDSGTGYATQALADAAKAAFLADCPTYSWSATCPDGTSDSGTGYATQALADAAKAAFLADCPTYSWSATCPDGTSDSGTGYATQALADAAKAAFLADCPTYSWSASCPDGTSDSGTGYATQALADAAKAAFLADCPTYSWSASCPDGTSDSGTGYATQALADAAKAAFLADCPTYSWSASCPDGTSDSGTGYATQALADAAKAAFLANCGCPDGFEQINGQGPCVAECGDCQNRNLQGDCIWQCYSGEICINGRCGNPCDIPGFPCRRDQQEQLGEETSTPTTRTSASGQPFTRASGEPATTVTAGATTSTTTVTAGGHLLGGDGAAVQIVVYEDFGCSFCREFGREVIPVLEEEYIDAGTVSLEYRHLAILGPESVNAAAAAECAADQDLFWPYHDLLVGETVRTYQEHARTLQATAAGAALDLETFDACVEAGTHVAAVQAATAQARNLLTGSGAATIAVPLFLVDDAFWRIGIPSMDELRTEIARAQAEPGEAASPTAAPTPTP